MLAIESALGRAGQLQRHQEIGRRAHAVGEAVRQVEHRRLAGAGRERDVVEAQRERVLARRACRRSARRRTARTASRRSSSKPDDLQEVLVPAHGDAVFGDAAEARHHAVVERLAQRRDVADRLERRRARPRSVTPESAGSSGSILQAVDADDRVAVVQQVMREREAGRPHADDQHALARCAAAAAGAAG